MNNFYNWLARFLPQRLVFYAFFRFWAHATTTGEGRTMIPDEMMWTKAIELWEGTYGT